MLVVRHGKPIVASTYKGKKREYKGTTIEIEEFWFCPDPIACCVMGPKRSYVLTRPEILEIWHVLTSTNLTRTKGIELEEFRFHVQSSVPIFPRRLLSSSILFGMANMFGEVVRHPLKITAISGRVQGM